MPSLLGVSRITCLQSTIWLMPPVTVTAGRPPSIAKKNGECCKKTLELKRPDTSTSYPDLISFITTLR